MWNWSKLGIGSVSTIILDQFMNISDISIQFRWRWKQSHKKIEREKKPNKNRIIGRIKVKRNNNCSNNISIRRIRSGRLCVSVCLCVFFWFLVCEFTLRIGHEEIEERCGAAGRFLLLLLWCWLLRLFVMFLRTITIDFVMAGLVTVCCDLSLTNIGCNWTVMMEMMLGIWYGWCWQGILYGRLIQRVRIVQMVMR